ncbi:MAG: hypothetical protein H6492_01945, partial [Candidatus Paracaedibacteraceae bacterium]|nr:hypothetical protein [Candidatus Paracaedibacteraceae bacterium]
WPYADADALTAAVGTVLEHHTVRSAVTNADAVALDTALMTQLEEGIVLPTAESRTTDVGTAVDTAVDNGTTAGAYDLIAALTPGDRQTTDVTTTVYPGAGNGNLYTGLVGLTWLVGDWTANAVAWNGNLANIDAVINQAITDETATITNIFKTGDEIRDAVKARIVADLIPAVGTIVGDEANSLAEKVNAAFADGQVITAISGNNSGALNTRLNALLEPSLSAFLPWINRNDTGTDHIGTLVNTPVGEVAFFGANYSWDADAMKAALLTKLSTAMGASFTSPLQTAVDTAFADLVTGGGNELANGFTPDKAAISTAADAALQNTFTGANFPWYAAANVTAINAMVTAAFENATAVDTALDALVTGGSVEGANTAEIATTFMTALKTYFDDDTRMALPTTDSLFGASVDAAILAVNLSAAATTVTTAVDGVAETFERYRTDVAHLTDTESAAQWMEYLSYQLLPAAQGGLGATTIDISARPISRDHFTNFMAALNDGRFDAYRASITTIKIALNNANQPVQLNGGGKTYNDSLQIIAIMDQDPNQTVTLGSDGDGLKNSGGQDLPNSIIDFRITSAPDVTATATAWERYLNQQLSTTQGGASATTLDLSGTHEFVSQAQLNAFFAGLEALDGLSGKANKNVLTALTLKLATGDFGSDTAHIGHTGADDVTNLNANINVTVHRNNARNGADNFDPIVIIDHSIIDALSSVDGTIVDNSDAANPTLDSSASWLEYLTSTLTAANAGYTLDLTGAAFTLADATHGTALGNALKALPTTLKNKVGAIQLTASADVTVGTGVTGFDNLVWISLDKPAGNTITLEGSLATKRIYIPTLAHVTTTSDTEWSYYANYQLSAASVGGAAVTTINVDAVSLNSDGITALLDGLDLLTGTGVMARKADIQTLNVTLASGDFGAASIDLSGRTGLYALTAATITRNGAVNTGTTDPVTITFGSGVGRITDAITTITDPITQDGTAGNEVALNNAQHWLEYLTSVLTPLNGTANTLDLTGAAFTLADATHGTALGNALKALPTTLKNKVGALHLKASGNVTVGTGVTGFDNLVWISLDKPAVNTITLAGSLATKRVYIPTLANVTTTSVAEWSYYANYQLSAASVGGAAATTIDVDDVPLNSAGVTALLDGLDLLTGTGVMARKADIQTLNVTLASGNFGAASIDLSARTGLYALTAATITRNGAVNTGTTDPVTITFGSGVGRITDAITTITDPTAVAVASQSSAQDWLAYLTSTLTQAGADYTLNLTGLALATDTSQAEATALMTALQALDTTLKAKIDTINIKLAAGDHGVGDITFTGDLRSSNGFQADLKVYVDVAGVTTDGTTQKAVVFANGVNTFVDTPANAQGHVSTVSAVVKDSSNSWAYYLNWLATQEGGIATIDTTAVDLPAQADFTALHTAMAARSDKNTITAIDIQLAAAFGDGTLTIPALAANFTGLVDADSFKIYRHGATNGGNIVSIAYDAGDEAVVQIVDPTRDGQGGNAVTLDNAQHWLEYLTHTLNEANAGYALDLSGLTLTAAGDGTALGSALNALDSGLKAKIATLKVAASADVTISTDFSTGFTALTAIELDKPAVNTITVSTPGAAQLRITDTAKVNKAAAADWQAYIQHLMVGAGADYTLDLTALTLSTAASQAEANALMTALQALDNSLKAKIDTINIKLAAGDHGADPLDLTGELRDVDGFTALTRVIVDVTDAETDAQIQKIINWAGLSTAAEVKKVMWVSALGSVDYEGANAEDSWLAYINYLVSEENSALNTSAINGGNGLTVAQLNTVFDAIATFAVNGDNIARLTSVTAKLSAAPEAGTFAVNQNLSALSGLTSIIIDATGAADSGAQVTVGFGGAFHANTTTKAARITDINAVDLDSADSWTYYLNWLATQEGGIATITTAVDLPAQADFTALHTAMAARSDKNTITAIDIQLAAAFGDGTLTIPALAANFTGLVDADSFKIYRHGATNGGNIVSIAYDAGDEAVVQIVDPTRDGQGGNAVTLDNAQHWLEYLTHTLNEANAGYALDLSGLTLTAAGDGTALGSALNALDSGLKAKIATLKVAASADVTISTDFSTGFTALTAIELDKPAVNTITVSTPGAAQLRITDTAKVNKAAAADWQAYIQHLMVGAGADYTLNLTGLALATATSQAEANALMTALQALDTTLKAKIDTINIKLAAGNHGAGDITFTGDLRSTNGFQADLKVYVDVSGVTTDDTTQKTVAFANGVNSFVDTAANAQGHVSTVSDVVLASALNIDTATLTQDIGFIQTGDILTAQGNVTDAIGLVQVEEQIDAGNAITAASSAVTDAITAIQALVIHTALGIDQHIADALAALTDNAAQDALDRLTYAQQRVDVEDWLEAEGALTAAGNFITAANTALQDAVDALQVVVLDSHSADSWAYYLNWLATQVGGIASIDLSLKAFTTAEDSYAFFTALDARTTDKASVKDIFVTLNGAGVAFVIGEKAVDDSATELTGLTSVIVRDIASDSVTADGTGVEANDFAIIKAATNEAGAGGDILGVAGTVSQWKGYLAYRLEDAAHGGSYTGASPIALDLTAADLQADNTTTLDALEQALAELPARLKGRISGVVLKTSDAAGDYSNIPVIIGDSADLSYPTVLTAVNWTTWIDAYYTETGSATLDLKGISFTNQDQLNEFFTGLRDAANKANITRIDIDLNGYNDGGVAIFGQDTLPDLVSGLNNTLKVMVFNKPGVITLVGAAGATGSAGQIDTDEIFDLTIPAPATATAGNWATWIDTYYMTGSTLDLRDVSFTNQAQLNAFFAGLRDAVNKANIIRIDFDLTGYNDGGVASFGFDGTVPLVGLDDALKINVFNKPGGINLVADPEPGSANQIDTDEIFDLTIPVPATATAADWTTWVDAYYASTGSATIDLKTVPFASQAQLNAFFEGLGNADNKANITRIDLNLDGYTDVVDNKAIFGRDTNGDAVSGLANDLTVYTFDKPAGITLSNNPGIGYEFGDRFTAPILAEFDQLRAVIIDASVTVGGGSAKPVYDTDGAFFSTTSISKIVY